MLLLHVVTARTGRGVGTHTDGDHDGRRFAWLIDILSSFGRYVKFRGTTMTAITATIGDGPFTFHIIEVEMKNVFLAY